MGEKSHFGVWTTDTVGLPCFDLVVDDRQTPEAPFRHLIGTGHVSAMADRWGNVNLFTTEGGFTWLNSPDSSFSRSSLYMMMEVEGEPISLLYSELTRKEKIRIGTGYVEYIGEVECRGSSIRIVQQIFAMPGLGKAIQGTFTLTNLGDRQIKLGLQIRSDVNPTRSGDAVHHVAGQRPSLIEPGRASFHTLDYPPGGVFLTTDDAWRASAQRLTLRLDREVVLRAGGSFSVPCAIGYGSPKNVAMFSLAETQKAWNCELAPYAVDAPETWMRHECLWNAGQLLAFRSYDSSVGEYYLALGGYGWAGFGVREVSESSLVLAAVIGALPPLLFAASRRLNWHLAIFLRSIPCGWIGSRPSSKATTNFGLFWAAVRP